MNAKIRISQRNINKVLDYISNYKISSNRRVYIDENFYNGLRSMNKIRINQTLNAMEELNIIEKFPPSYNHAPYIRLSNGAFSYRLLRKQNTRRFIIPTIISIIALLKSFDREILLLAELIVQKLK